MSTRLLLGFVATAAMLTALPATAGPADGLLKCQSGKFVGTYTLLLPANTYHGDVRYYPFFLTFNADGTLRATNMIAGELPISTGYPSETVGVWSCLPDNNILIKKIFSIQLPMYDGRPDVYVDQIYKDTDVYTINDADTVSRVYQNRRLCFPSNPDMLNSSSSDNCAEVLVRFGGPAFKRMKTTTEDLGPYLNPGN